jgi:hypothetical protein
MGKGCDGARRNEAKHIRHHPSTPSPFRWPNFFCHTEAEFNDSEQILELFNRELPCERAGRGDTGRNPAFSYGVFTAKN